MHGNKEAFSLAYNSRLPIEETVCKLTGRSIVSLSSREARSGNSRTTVQNNVFASAIFAT